MAAEILRKITAKHVLGERPDAPKAGERTPLMKVWGMARDVSVLANQMGEYAKFRGRFQAVNITTGTLYEAGTMILPEPASGMLYGALAEENAQSVSFAFEIGVKGDKSSITGYEYYARPLIESDQADPLALMAEQIGVNTAALDAPKPEPETAPEPEPAKGGKAK